MAEAVVDAKCTNCGGTDLVQDPSSGQFYCKRCNPPSFRRVKRAVNFFRGSVSEFKGSVREFKSEFSTQLVTLVTAAFGFAAALFWNQAITAFIKSIVPQAESWEYQLLAAVAVTFVAVLAIYLISKWAGKKKEQAAQSASAK